MRLLRLVGLFFTTVLCVAVLAPPASALQTHDALAADGQVTLHTAKKAQRLLRKAVADAEAAYRAEGKLEVQAFSLDGTSAWDLLQQVQVNSVGDAYKCGQNVQQVLDEVSESIGLDKRGDSRRARGQWTSALRKDLPRLRTWLAAYRGKVLTLASDVNYAVAAVGKPWVANPAIEEKIDDTLLTLDARLRQVQRLAR